MARWADFGISRVKYDRDHQKIVEVEVRADHGESIGEATKVARQDVVRSIEAGRTYVTIFHENGRWKKGEDVHVVTIRSQKYLRTDRNAIEKDNLGSLPEYQ
jgi:hypothetical protein